jgi:pyruvate carboxylase
MPGGQYTNLLEQAQAMGLGARWHEIARTYADVNFGFGDIVKVTPSSKVVGDMAIFLVNHNMTMKQFSQLTPDHNLTLPSSVIDMFMGSLGEPEGGWPKQLQKIILKGAKPQRGRPGALLPAVDLEETAAAVEKKIGRKPAHDEVLSYLMYPDVFLKFARAKQSWGDIDVLPTPQFYYGMKRGDDITVELEPGKALAVKFLTVGEPHPDGTRTVFFELNGQPREVTVRDRALEVTEKAKPKADAAVP